MGSGPPRLPGASPTSDTKQPTILDRPAYYSSSSSSIPILLESRADQMLLVMLEAGTQVPDARRMPSRESLSSGKAAHLHGRILGSANNGRGAGGKGQQQASTNLWVASHSPTHHTNLWLLLGQAFLHLWMASYFLMKHFSGLDIVYLHCREEGCSGMYNRIHPDSRQCTAIPSSSIHP